MAPNDNGVDPLLVEVDGREALEASVVIPEEAVYPEEANHAVVAEHFEHVAATLVVVTICGGELLQALLLPLEDLRDHGLLDQRLQVVEDPVDVPGLHVRSIWREQSSHSLTLLGTLLGGKQLAEQARKET